MGHLTPKFIKAKFLEESQTLIVKYIINQFLLTRRQKKRYEQAYNILKSLYQNICGFLDPTNRQRSYQSDEVLWMHVIDPICMSFRE